MGPRMGEGGDGSPSPETGSEASSKRFRGSIIIDRQCILYAFLLDGILIHRTSSCMSSM